MKFLQTLAESRFLSSKGSFHKFSAKQVAELTYLHIIGLRILAAEKLTHDWGKDYAFRTQRYSGFSRWYQNATDLHLLIHALVAEDVELKLPDSSMEFKESLYFDEAEVLSWLRDVYRDVQNTGKTKRLFMHLDGMLQIKDASMKAIRRLVQDWTTNSARQKQLAMTRLLQMLRIRARQSDILVRLEAVATHQNLELKNVDNPETGDERREDGADPHHLHEPAGEPGKVQYSGGNMLKGLAAFAGGAMLGYHTVKAMAESEGQDVIHEPTLAKLIEMKLRADHADGLCAVIAENGMYVFDGSHLNHDMVKKSLGIKEAASIRIWSNYVELVEGNLEWSSHPTLVEFYEGVEAEIIMEDASAGATCAAAIAPNVKVMGKVQRRPMPYPNASIYGTQKKAKKKKKSS